MEKEFLISVFGKKIYIEPNTNESRKKAIIEYISGQTSKVYTPLRKFYAWYGFINLMIHIIAIIGFIVWSNNIIKGI